MKCNIRTIERGTKQVKCFKTKYKNIVICELDNRCYSITHYKTGIALSFNRYATKQEAINKLFGYIKCMVDMELIESDRAVEEMNIATKKLLDSK